MGAMCSKEGKSKIDQFEGSDFGFSKLQMENFVSKVFFFRK